MSRKTIGLTAIQFRALKSLSRYPDGAPRGTVGIMPATEVIIKRLGFAVTVIKAGRFGGYEVLKLTDAGRARLALLEGTEK